MGWLFKGNKTAAELTQATDEMDRAWDNLPTTLTTAQAVRIRKIKDSLARFMESNASVDVKKETVDKINRLLAVQVEAHNRFNRPINEQAFNILVLSIENMVSPQANNLGALLNIYQEISLGEYDRVVPAEQRGAVEDRLCTCFMLYQAATLTDEQRAVVDKLVEGIRSALTVGPTEANVLMAIDRVMVQIKHPNPKTFLELYEEKVNGVNDFMSGVEDALQILKSDILREGDLAEALTKVMQEIGAKVAEARAVNNVQRNNALTQTFANVKSDRNRHTNNVNVLNARLAALQELHRKIEYLMNAGVSLDQINMLFENTTYKSLLNENYKYISEALDEMIKNADTTVVVREDIYHNPSVTVVGSTQEQTPELIVDDELEAIVNNINKAEDLNTETPVKESAQKTTLNN